MENAGLWLKRNKCVFLAPSVIYLGYRINAQGIHVVAEKVNAIQDAPQLRNGTKLKSYLGLLTYYSRFLHHIRSSVEATEAHHTIEMEWATREGYSKKLLLSSQLLVHFDPNFKIQLAHKASAYRIGAVLSHQMHDGSNKPVGFVPWTLSEKRYLKKIEKALACLV